MASPPDRPGLKRAVLLPRDSIATQASNPDTTSLGTRECTTLSTLPTSASPSRPCHDIGTSLSSGPSIRNSGAWGVKPKLERSNGGFSLTHEIQAEVYRKKSLHLPGGGHTSRRSQAKASGNSAETYRGRTRPPTATAGSQSTLAPRSHADDVRSASRPRPFPTPNESREPSDALPEMVVEFVKGKPEARHDAARLALKYLLDI